MDPDIQCKLVLVGNGSVGKTSIIARFVDDGFQPVYKQTVGVDFFEKLIELKGNSVRMKLQVWDIGGQSISSKMLSKYIYGSRVVFLCYDVTDQESFNDLEDWLAMVKRVYVDKISGEKLPLPNVQLLGNKVDLINLRRVAKASHERFIRENNLNGGCFCSAQSGDNVLRSFYSVAAGVANVSLSEYELAFYDKVLAVAVGSSAEGGAAEEGRTAIADQIEAEDLAAEEAKRRKQQRKDKNCNVM